MTVATSAAVDGAQVVSRSDGRFSVGVHYLRGLAALGVMLYHSSEYISRIMGEAGFRPYLTPILGLVGVAVFFAVSGYLMAGLIREQRPAEFLLRRVWRIFPLYLIITLVVVALGPLRPFEVAADAPSLLLAPLGYVTKQPLGIEWTLVSEVSFYAALALLAVLSATRALPFIALAWLTAIIGYVVMGQLSPAEAPQTPIGAATLETLPLMEANLAFAAGLLIPWLPKRPVLWAALGAATIGLLILPPWTHRLTAGIAAVLFVAAAAQSDFKVTGAAHRSLMALGDWSYPLYLVHVVVFKTVMTMCETNHVSPGLGWIAAVSVAIGLAALLAPLDKALHLGGKRVIAAAGPIPLWGAAIAFAALYLCVSLPAAGP